MILQNDLTPLTQHGRQTIFCSETMTLALAFYKSLALNLNILGLALAIKSLITTLEYYNEASCFFSTVCQTVACPSTSHCSIVILYK